MSDSWLIVGLGNPGRAYQKTRHNIGFVVADAVAKECRLKFKRSIIYKGLLAQDVIDGKKVFVLKPLTYMNNSGMAVRTIVRKKKIDLENILVVCDDLDLDFGRLRLRAKGSGSGHKGLYSIIAQVGSQEFARLKLGIGRSRSKIETTDFVLSEFTSREKKAIDHTIEKATDCCLAWIKNGIASAMNQFNKS